MDYQAAYLNPIYTIQGVPCVLSIGSADHNVTVLDKTAGVVVGSNTGQVDTILPAALVRAVELATVGVSPDDLEDAIATFNGQAWVVESHQMKPSPKGEADGEVYLYLKKKRP